MTQLAIKGYEPHGEDVIKILEMLGGKNTFGLSGDASDLYYFIDSNNKISYTYTSSTLYKITDFKIFTVEEFREKYPYKVGDKVTVTGLSEYPKIIKFMKWFDDDIHYSFDNETWFPSSALILYKEEETAETITIDDFKANTKEWLIDKLHDMVISKAIKTIGDIHEELHKPQYPKTYEECCKVLGIDFDNYLSIRNLYRDDGEEETTDYESDLLGVFDHLWELTICRDAYWKIAGEQMGLGRPWVPDWNDSINIKYIIGGYKNKIVNDYNYYIHNILAFPTEEMRVAFNENFKELIEACRDFL